MSAEQRALTERIAAIDQQAMAEGRIVGSVVLVARQGEICYAGAAGYADREVRRPMRRKRSSGCRRSPNPTPRWRRCA